MSVRNWPGTITTGAYLVHPFLNLDVACRLTQVLSLSKPSDYTKKSNMSPLENKRDNLLFPPGSFFSSFNLLFNLGMPMYSWNIIMPYWENIHINSSYCTSNISPLLVTSNKQLHSHFGTEVSETQPVQWLFLDLWTFEHLPCLNKQELLPILAMVV